jgi:dTDP-4-dehydrorhamnose 3,5-epimerase
LLEGDRFQDERGNLDVSFQAEEFAWRIGYLFEIDQIMHSFSRPRVIRGLHYQDHTAPVAKLISCLQGRIYDVVVDLRAESETYGQGASVYLDEYDNRLILAPVGTAHGFASLGVGKSIVLYYQDGMYSPEASQILAWDDPDLAIKWPVSEPILSERDRTQGISWLAYMKEPVF